MAPSSPQRTGAKLVPLKPEVRLDSPTEALVHLLACLDRAAEVLRECMFDVDAKVVEAHRAQLARGKEWPGDPIEPIRWLGPVAAPVDEEER